MLKIVVPEKEFFNEKTFEFYKTPETVLNLEHSLYAISKWECKFEKSFFSKKDKTEEELYEYIRCMNEDDEVDILVIKSISREQIKEITQYMNRKMTGRSSPFKSEKGKGAQYTTSEDLYYAMFVNGIPLECEHWHFNKLLAVLRYCGAKSDTRKVSQKEQAATYRELNMQRRKAMHSKG